MALKYRCHLGATLGNLRSNRRSPKEHHSQWVSPAFALLLLDHPERDGACGIVAGHPLRLTVELPKINLARDHHPPRAFHGPPRRGAEGPKLAHSQLMYRPGGQRLGRPLS
jgi:hypothetical protein